MPEAEVLEPTEEKKDEEVPTPIPVAKDVAVFARNPQEMATANTQLIQWADGKAASLRAERDELQVNLDIAKKNKWRTETLKKTVARLNKQIDMIARVRSALALGYCIVPTMDIDIFAVRTSREAPKNDVQTSTNGRVPFLADVKPDHTPEGEGEYVSIRPDGEVTRRQIQDPKKPNDPNARVEMVVNKAVDFLDVDFPFKFAKPEVLDATGKAMALKLFDEIGILPRRRGGDPMVIGRIGWTNSRWGNEKPRPVDFVIAWFIDTKDLF